MYHFTCEIFEYNKGFCADFSSQQGDLPENLSRKGRGMFLRELLPKSHYQFLNQRIISLPGQTT
jgi:hypothetical protein